MPWGIASTDAAASAEGRADDDLWVFGSTGAAYLASHWDGATWKPITLPGAATSVESLAGESHFHAVSRTSAWTIVSKHAYFWNGVTWTDTGAIPTASTKPRIWGNGSSSALVVADDVYRWNGVTWSKLPFATSDFFAVGHGKNPARVVLLRDDSFARPPAVVLWNGGATLYPIDKGTLYPPNTSPASGGFQRWVAAFVGDTAWATQSSGSYAETRRLFALRDGCWAPIDDGFGPRVSDLSALTSTGRQVVASRKNNPSYATIEITP